MLLRNRWSGTLIVLLLLASSADAQGPRGEFLCQQQTGGLPSGSGYFTSVAHIHLNSDGTFLAKDVTTSVPEVHGHFSYNAKAKTIEWDSGIWRTLLGHYLPHSSSVPVFIVTTKKDPEGKVDGTFRCVRMSK